jgi:hypothetical protein
VRTEVWLRCLSPMPFRSDTGLFNTLLPLIANADPAAQRPQFLAEERSPLPRDIRGPNESAGSNLQFVRQRLVPAADSLRAWAQSGNRSAVFKVGKTMHFDHLLARGDRFAERASVAFVPSRGFKEILGRLEELCQTIRNTFKKQSRPGQSS